MDEESNGLSIPMTVIRNMMEENKMEPGKMEPETILQEKGNCYLYEKMGYWKTGKTEKINERMTLVFYRKP